jgi:uncharacterized membrane protein YhaH (DUF805 family)
MDAEQRSFSQTVVEALVGHERHVSASNRHPWWAWIVILFACLGILFVLAILFSAAFREQTNPAFWVQLYQTVGLLAVSN